MDVAKLNRKILGVDLEYLMLTQERAVSKVQLKSLQQERYSQSGQRKLLVGSMRRS